jgi:hypothetical protein
MKRFKALHSAEASLANIDPHNMLRNRRYL